MALRKKKRLTRDRGPRPDEYEPDLLGILVRDFFSEKNKQTKTRLKNKADMASLVPLGLFVMGLMELFRNPEMPKWSECWWYSYRIFLDFNGWAYPGGHRAKEAARLMRRNEKRHLWAE